MAGKPPSKRDSLNGLIAEHHDRLSSLEQKALERARADSRPHAESLTHRNLRWFGRNWVSGLACLIALLAWWQPQWKKTGDEELSRKIDGRLESKIKDYNLPQMSSDVSELKGRMAEISSYLKMLMEKELPHRAALPQSQFDGQIIELGKALSLARTVHAPSTPRVLNEIALKLANSNSSQPAFWSAAGQLITYRSELKKNFERSPLRDCFNWGFARVPLTPQKMEISGEKPVFTAFLSNCSIQIDNLNGYSGSVLQQQIEKINSSFKSAFPSAGEISVVLDISHARVTYQGGELLPVRGFVFRDCTFDFEPWSVPSPPGRILTRGLLAANSPEVRVDLPDTPS